MRYTKGFAGIGMIIAIVAVLAVGGGLYIYNIKKAEVPSTETETEAQKQTTTQIQQTNTQTQLVNTQTRTSNWKTYTNTKYGFEFGHPQGWRVYEEGKGNFKIENPKGSILGLIIKDATHRTLEEKERELEWKFQKITFASFPALKYSVCDIVCSPIIFLMHSGQEFTFHYSSDDADFIKHVEDIFSTFKFTK